MKRNHIRSIEVAAKQPAPVERGGLGGFFSAAQLRVDRWRHLHHLAARLL